MDNLTDFAKNVRCAILIGFEPYDDQESWRLPYPGVACRLGSWAGQCLVYDPMNIDEQAYRLIKQIGLQVSSIWNIQAGTMQTWCVDFGPAHGSDPNLNLAIVTCASQITKR